MHFSRENWSDIGTRQSWTENTDCQKKKCRFDYGMQIKWSKMIETFLTRRPLAPPLLVEEVCFLENVSIIFDHFIGFPGSNRHFL